MAVQKNRKSRSKRGMRRSHLHIKTPTLTENKVTGEVHVRHQMDSQGEYRGRTVVVPKTVAADNEE